MVIYGDEFISLSALYETKRFLKEQRKKKLQTRHNIIPPTFNDDSDSDSDDKNNQEQAEQNSEPMCMFLVRQHRRL